LLMISHQLVSFSFKIPVIIFIFIWTMTSWRSIVANIFIALRWEKNVRWMLLF
jgi:hypothetical protein